LIAGIGFLLTYLRRRNTIAAAKTLSAEDNQRIDALLRAASKDERGEMNG
jgi:cytochrome c-type biogenesis protein CcmH